MSEWVRKRFEGAGLTQSPPGPHFAALRAKYRSTVLLCLDVSGSMAGPRLTEAIAGGEQFLAEAFAARYDCGLVLWNHEIAEYVPPGASQAALTDRLGEAFSHGGTNLVPTLEVAGRDLAPLPGDRVLCVFGDGDVGDPARAKELARGLCASGVRIIVRGLGPGATSALSALACPGQRDERRLIADEKSIRTGIASMATGLSRAARRGTGE
ncbi:vWA domain-containing protein [Amycolatopsis rifamycinica]|uniref:VWFA domain-containing protein n=1 Tax=Amycolatopsis rifamycinica TaxID=287986 RepID=A0A066UD12_9PSEU|nr:vWA domain-containing protein [Amycolatopsis rifamycinica]KDN22108.1 hypothetical protein DV20_12050 [Amycolatopsis rifamycinica]